MTDDYYSSLSSDELNLQIGEIEEDKEEKNDGSFIDRGGVAGYLNRNYKSRTIGKEATPYVLSGLNMLSNSIDDTMKKSRHGLLGPHAFVFAHAMNIGGKLLNQLPDIPLDDWIADIAHNQVGIDRPLADVSGEVLEMLATRKLIKATPGAIKAVSPVVSKTVTQAQKTNLGTKISNIGKPVSQQTVNVKGVTVHGPGIAAESSKTIAEQYPFLVRNVSKTNPITDLTKIKKGSPYAMLSTLPVTTDSSLLQEASSIKGFTNVGEVETAKISLQKELDFFRNTPEGIKLKKDAYLYFEANGSLEGFPTPAGYSVRRKGTVLTNDEKGLSIASDQIRNLESIKRMFPQRPDVKSILPIFQEKVGTKLAEKEALSYINTNKKVYTQVTKAITEYNKKIKANNPHLTKEELAPLLLTKEHIFDVDFHNRLQKIVPNFSAKGANELTNISILDLALNSQLGAQAGANKKLDVSDPLIKTVQEGVGVNYIDSINDFITYDIGRIIERFNKLDWEMFLGEVMESRNTGRTLQDILVEFIRKTKKDVYL